MKTIWRHREGILIVLVFLGVPFLIFLSQLWAGPPGTGQQHQQQCFNDGAFGIVCPVNGAPP